MLSVPSRRSLRSDAEYFREIENMRLFKRILTKRSCYDSR
jgi:hypothetical protein